MYRNRRFLKTCLFIFILPAFLRASDAGTLPFGEKEEIVYNIRWSFINCGQSSLTIERISTSCFKITSLAKSYPFFDHFYKVRDRVEAWWDIKQMRSLRFEKHMREGKRAVDDLIEIDTAQNIAKRERETWAVTPHALDVLSSLYYIRLKNLTPGSSLVVDVYTKKKLWPLNVKVIRREKISVRDREYKTILVEPEMREEGIFKAKGRIWVWLTDDEKKIPVQMKSKIPIGSIIAEMIE
ncbi:MAG: DUF3108 domain-containing protein [bacterium]